MSSSQKLFGSPSYCFTPAQGHGEDVFVCKSLPLRQPFKRGLLLQLQGRQKERNESVVLENKSLTSPIIIFFKNCHSI